MKINVLKEDFDLSRITIRGKMGEDFSSTIQKYEKQGYNTIMYSPEPTCDVLTMEKVVRRKPKKSWKTSRFERGILRSAERGR